MALASTAFCNQALNGGDASGTPTNLMAKVSLHSASPGTTGANEMSGGGYAAQACSWNAASSSTKTNSSTLNFSTNGSTPVTHFGTQSTGAAYGIGGALTAPVTAAAITVAAGALTVSAA